MIIPSLVYYSVSCVLFHHLCITCVTFLSSCSWKLCITWSVGHFSASSVSFSGLHDNAVSYVLRGQLCTSPSVVHYSIGQLCTSLSVVHYSISCVLPSQFSQTRSVVLHSVSWMIIPSLVYYSVSCVLFHHLCITPSGEFNQSSLSHFYF